MREAVRVAGGAVLYCLAGLHLALLILVPFGVVRADVVPTATIVLTIWAAVAVLEAEG